MVALRAAQNLGNEGTAYVVEGLAFNNVCTTVDLSQNGIGQLGIAALSQARRPHAAPVSS